ncbi:MXAN_6652 family MXYO-CTERM-anchored protein [Myxococcus sp. RHSTA-1-4]|uniref:MXAN_6652 family MXYO-CTERM-anchored protein n=1 Tax=Myxococcus sp. RHSTA-1-4 TaxID=2874601 RepID=UPI001CBB0BFA|nr:MXAN_6652 family MXYO-CTERM-anchored protein [Myxococcus sp. RHSTA-1-4]MBZ4416085.1 hypothetical protein [Myxococcus sp. RHSTA-1-4]
MRSSLSSLRAAGVMAACLVSGSALAYSTGQSGYSGKPPAQSCMSSTCHSGGTTPTVTLEGPASLEAGATGNYKLVITGGPGVRGGFNVGVDNGTLQPGSGQKKDASSGELTHSQPKAFSNGRVEFDFTLVAPSSGGTINLYGAGNSTNYNQDEFGDGAAQSLKAITVTGGEDDGGGCAAAGGAPLLGAVLMVLGARLGRRRK